jgi:hypothetical protein
MRQARRILFVNFFGLGNGICLLPLLKRLEEVRTDWTYFSTDNPVFDSQLPAQLGLRRFVGVIPGIWRRFNRADWTSIETFLAEQHIDLIINLRNLGPQRDPGYHEFKQVAARSIEFWDLDHAELSARSNHQLHVLDLVSLLREHGVDLSGFDATWMRRIVGSARASRHTTIGFFTGSAQHVKRLPALVWARVANSLLERPDYRVVVYAGRDPEERALADEVMARTSAIAHRRVLVEGLATDEFCRSIGGCDVLVSNDSSAVHIASALGVPVVGVYSATDPRIWGGLNDAFIAIESHTGRTCPSRQTETGNCDFYYGGCPGPCTQDISSGRIVTAIEQLLTPALDEPESSIGTHRAML